MNYNNIPEKPLVASVNTKQQEQVIGRTFFFERPDGSRISTEEKEAWNLYTRIPQELGTRKPGFKFLGSSDGTTYQQAVFEAQQIFLNTNDLKMAQDRLRQGEVEEFEKARGNMKPPRNMDVMGPGANQLQI
jgi:hypothetical protein